jgi:hypothetical protein
MSFGEYKASLKGQCHENQGFFSQLPCVSKYLCVFYFEFSKQLTEVLVPNPFQRHWRKLWPLVPLKSVSNLSREVDETARKKNRHAPFAAEKFFTDKKGN